MLDVALVLDTDLVETVEAILELAALLVGDTNAA